MTVYDLLYFAVLRIVHTFIKMEVEAFMVHRLSRFYQIPAVSRSNLRVFAFYTNQFI